MNNLVVSILVILVVVLLIYYFMRKKKVSRFTPDVPGSYYQDPAARIELNALDVIQGSM